MQQLLRYIQEQLQSLYPDAEIRSFERIILESVCSTDKPVLLRDKDKQLSVNEIVQAQKIVSDLRKYRPIQYILGETEFYGLPFKVNEQVLIPRPETEELVEQVINGCTVRDAPFTVHRLPCIVHRILDVGTGSGCIAIALAKNLPDAEVYALDISEEALEVARQNAAINNVAVTFFQQDILAAPPGIVHYEPCTVCHAPCTLPPGTLFSVIVSNPPYIVPSEMPAMSPNVLEYEPHQALFVPEEQPLLFYERIADLGISLLEDAGMLFFETNALFAPAVAAMLRNKGYGPVAIFRDISGKDRIVKGIKNAPVS